MIEYWIGDTLVPDVSVVIPCYNCEPFIRECVLSIARQQDVTFEILAVEDRSTDRSWDILQELAAEVPQLRLFRMEQNSGQARARNLGIDHATGRYLALLDSDDLYAGSDVLSRWIAVADADDLDLTASQYIALNMDGDQWPGARVPKLAKSGVPLKDAKEVVNVGMSWQFLFRRAFVEENRIRFSERLRQREDRLFFCEALLLAQRIGVADLETVIYRQHPNSTMKRLDHDQMAQYVEHMNILDTAQKAALKDGRTDLDFCRANSVSYWSSSIHYWARLLAEMLDKTVEDSADPAEDAPLFFNFFDALSRLADGVGPLWKDRYFERGGAEKLKYEAELDIARMAYAARDLTVLGLILRRQRVHHSKLWPLVETSGFDWAEEAVLRYLCFNRHADFDEDPANPPPLRSLVKRVVLHIGLPKTGTSAVQAFLERNRFDLLDKGIWYPMHGAGREQGMRRDRSSGHLALMRSIVLDERADDFTLGMRREIAGLGQPVETLVLSCENILSHAIWTDHRIGDLASHPLTRILKALDVERVDVIAGLRRQDHWFASYYREILCNPFNHVVAGPLTFFEALRERGLFDHESLVAYIGSHPRVSALIVEDFDEIRAKGGAIPWFLDVTGLQDGTLDVTHYERQNESFSDAFAANVKALKLLNLPRERVSQIFRDLTESDIIASSDFALVSASDQKRIQTLLRKDLEAHDARFGAKPPLAATSVAAAGAGSLPLFDSIARAEPEHLWLGLPTEEDDNPVDKPIATLRGEHYQMYFSRSWRYTSWSRTVVTFLKSVWSGSSARPDEASKKPRN